MLIRSNAMTLSLSLANAQKSALQESFHIMIIGIFYDDHQVKLCSEIPNFNFNIKKTCFLSVLMIFYFMVNVGLGVDESSLPKLLRS